MPAIKEALVTGNDRYKKNVKLTPVGVVLHSVGTPQPSAEVFVGLWQRNASPYFTHYVLDDTDIYHTMPNDRQCAHVGGPGNSKWLGIEMCEPNTIRYTSGASFKVTNPDKARAFVQACYENAVWLIARLCREYGWDPQAAILTHGEVTAKKLSNTSHVDPEHLWKGVGLSYSLQTLKKDVAAAMGVNLSEPTEKPAEPAQAAVRTLHTGISGEDVQQLQKRLMALGYDCGSKGADGHFGKDTKAAVEAFQRDHTDQNGSRLAVDGRVGPATRWALDKAEQSGQEPAGSEPEMKTLDMARNIDPDLAGRYRVLADDGLNLRTGAGSDKPMLGVLPTGATVTCYGYYNVAGNMRRWLLVVGSISGKSVTGYCSELYLRK